MRITEYCVPHKPGNHDASEAYPLVDAERERKKENENDRNRRQRKRKVKERKR